MIHRMNDGMAGKETGRRSRWLHSEHLALVGILVVSVPVLAAAEAGLEYIRTMLGKSENHFLWMFRTYTIAWIELALCVPIAVGLARRVPFRAPHRVRAFAVHLTGSAVFGVAHLLLDTVQVNLIQHTRVPLLGWTAYLISWYMLRDVFIYWTIVGILQAVWFQRALRQRELGEARLRADLATARLAALQSRLEPHFLFNALNTAVMMVRGDNRDRAVEVLLELSELLRSVIRVEAAPTVPLDQEWEFIRRYLALEKARFEDGLTVDMDLAPSLKREKVPFLTLQPLVENALRHGVAQRTGDGPGKVEVIARREGETLRLEVWDNGPGPAGGTGVGITTQSEAHTGLGLANVRARLRELYGERGHLTIEPAPGGGTLATVTLPCSGA